MTAAGCSFTVYGKSFLETLMRGIGLQRYSLDVSMQQLNGTPPSSSSQDHHPALGGSLDMDGTGGGGEW